MNIPFQTGALTNCQSPDSDRGDFVKNVRTDTETMTPMTISLFNVNCLAYLFFSIPTQIRSETGITRFLIN